MYHQNIKLEDNEQAFKVNVETGDVKELPFRKNNIPIDKEKLKYNEFVILNKKMQYLIHNNVITHEENSVLMMLSHMTEIGTNSLDPISLETNYVQWGEYVNLDRRKIKTIREKLFKIGAIASFRYFSDRRQKEVEMLILNPIVSFRGRLIPKDISMLFRDTLITRLLK